MALFGDRRAVNEVKIIGNLAYVDGEAPGPPAKWAAAPPVLPKVEKPA